MPFQPEGERALWRLALDVFQAVPDGTTVRHADLAEALGVSPEARERIWAAVNNAGRQLRESSGRTVTSVRNVGYRVDSPGTTEERVAQMITPALIAAVVQLIDEAKEEIRRERHDDATG